MVKITVSIEGDAAESVVDVVGKSLAAVAQVIQEQPPVVINHLLSDSVHDAPGASPKSADDRFGCHDS